MVVGRTVMGRVVVAGVRWLVGLGRVEGKGDGDVLS